MINYCPADAGQPCSLDPGDAPRLPPGGCALLSEKHAEAGNGVGLLTLRPDIRSMGGGWLRAARKQAALRSEGLAMDRPAHGICCPPPAGAPLLVPVNVSLPGFRAFPGRSWVGQYQLACRESMRHDSCRLLGSLEVRGEASGHLQGGACKAAAPPAAPALPARLQASGPPPPASIDLSPLAAAPQELHAACDARPDCQAITWNPLGRSGINGSMGTLKGVPGQPGAPLQLSRSNWNPAAVLLVREGANLVEEAAQAEDGPPPQPAGSSSLAAGTIAGVAIGGAAAAALLVGGGALLALRRERRRGHGGKRGLLPIAAKRTRSGADVPELNLIGADPSSILPDGSAAVVHSPVAAHVSAPRGRFPPSPPRPDLGTVQAPASPDTAAGERGDAASEPATPSSRQQSLPPSLEWAADLLSEHAQGWQVGGGGAVPQAAGRVHPSKNKQSISVPLGLLPHPWRAPAGGGCAGVGHSVPDRRRRPAHQPGRGCLWHRVSCAAGCRCRWTATVLPAGRGAGCPARLAASSLSWLLREPAAPAAALRRYKVLLQGHTPCAAKVVYWHGRQHNVLHFVQGELGKGCCVRSAAALPSAASSQLAAAC